VAVAAGGAELSQVGDVVVEGAGADPELLGIVLAGRYG
jgi:hypothetical protein